MSANAAPVRFEFGRFVLDPVERRFLSDGVPVGLGTRAFDVLVLLVERAGSLVTKDELLERVWSRVRVEENAVQVQVSALRRVIGARAIGTVSGHGYRFELEVTRIAAAPVAPPAPPNNLNEPLSSFIGREREIAELAPLLDATRLLTLVGAGGCGKSRLALQIARGLLGRCDDAVWWVELAAVTDAELVAEAVAARLPLQNARGRNVAQILTDHLAAQRCLIVLDNAEHLLDAVGALAEALLARCPGLRLLVTSRERLGVAGELTYRVPSLAVPDPLRDGTAARTIGFDAARLLIDRIRLQ